MTRGLVNRRTNLLFILLASVSIPGLQVVMHILAPVLGVYGRCSASLPQLIGWLPATLCSSIMVL